MAPNVELANLKQGETAVINGITVTNYSAMFFEIDGQLVSKDRLNDIFGKNDKISEQIAQYDAAIKDYNDAINLFDKQHKTCVENISIFRHEKRSILARAGVSDPNELEKDKKKDYDECNESQYNAVSGMHTATNKILSFTNTVVGLILHRGDLQSQQILSRHYNNFA